MFVSRIKFNMSLENYFAPFRENVVGRDQTFISPFGEQKIIYAW